MEIRANANIKYTNDFRTKIIMMRQTMKLTLIFSLMILANLAKAEETTTINAVGNEGPISDPIVPENPIIETVNEEKVVETIEHLSPDVETQTSGDHVTVVTTESPNTAEPVTDTTTLAETTSSNELTPTTTESDQIDCVCNCSANGSPVTLECSTQALAETQTDTTPNAENENSEATTLEPPAATNPTISDETSTKSNEIPESTSDSQITDTPTTAPVTNENSETTSAPEPTTTLAPLCTTPGVQPHDQDCKQYYDCSSEGFPDGTFHLHAKSCPNKQVFNSLLNRCSRDVSSCSDVPVQCLVKGGVADAASNTSYYLCEPRLIGGGFYVFHVECAANEIFYAALGKCFVDLNNLPTQGYPPYYWKPFEDLDIVKAEMKLLKEQDKLQLKQEKDKLKAEQNLQKQLEKEAKNRAKNEAKLNKEKAKMESLTFVCAAEGNFASTVAEDIYYACITKKDKLKALVMQCPLGSKFNAATGTCLQNTTTYTNNVYESDDEADD